MPLSVHSSFLRRLLFYPEGISRIIIFPVKIGHFFCFLVHDNTLFCRYKFPEIILADTVEGISDFPGIHTFFTA